jgi:hypothetical protein
MPARLAAMARRRNAVGLIVCLAALLGEPKTEAHDGGEQGTGPGRPSPLQAATRIPGRDTAPAPPQATGAIVGERWGCASYDTGWSLGYQCWEAGSRPRARRVPWMDGKRFQTAPEHLCSLSDPVEDFRCWKRPAPGERTARPLPADWQWLYPAEEQWYQTGKRRPLVDGAHVGGTFSCLRTTQGSGVFCFGDDRFGQRGGGTGAPTGNGGPRDRAFVPDVWPADFMAVGTWHGCAYAAPGGMAHGGHISCWGRADHGQLGAPAPDRCRVEGREVACARKPVKGVAVSDRETLLALGAGDLFTCLTNDQGIRCWGASRDAIFGAPGSCPESLRRAWPTLHGPVPAPRAACSPRPVPLPGATHFDPNFVVRPRAVCFDQGGAQTCLGAVPRPRGLSVAGQVISPGSDASACAVRDGRVFCWGEAYSPAQALDVPVAVTLEATAPLGESAVARSGGSRAWEDPGCLIRRGCPTRVRPLRLCARVAPRPGGGASAVPTWTELESHAEKLSGTVVRVRGPLGVEPVAGKGPACRTKDGQRACCGATFADVLLGGGSHANLALQGLKCGGDESLTCCNAPAYGQTVIASGRLTPVPDAVWNKPHWMLAKPKLCAE